MSDLVVSAAPRLHAELGRLAQARCVFFAGLPGTGKSLLLNQLAHLAHQAGRSVHLLQWDVARPRFESTPAAARYPSVGGVTHAVVRRAVGLWVRGAVLRWDRSHRAPEHLLVGETPFIGNRFVELARREADAAEAVLSATNCRFVLPVPTREVRAFLEAERDRRTARPRHEREKEDAPPDVLRALWRDVATIGRQLGVGAGTDAYDPDVYRAVYARVLRSRTLDVLTIDTVLPTRAMSVYDFTIARRDVVPDADDAEACVLEVERRYPDLAVLAREVDRWWDVAG
jgi:hypothetical protein